MFEEDYDGRMFLISLAILAVIAAGLFLSAKMRGEEITASTFFGDDPLNEVDRAFYRDHPYSRPD